MALSATVNKYLVRGWGARGNKIAIVTFTTDTDYPTGGYAVTGATLGSNWNEVSGVVPMGPLPSASLKYILSWDEANNKLMVLGTDDGAEAASGENELASVTWRTVVTGS
jgi:hypothetical protein